LITIGNGTATTESNEICDDLVKLPAGICLDENIEDLIDWVFPHINVLYNDPIWMCERAILMPKNNAVNNINTLMANVFPVMRFVLRVPMPKMKNTKVQQYQMSI
jgi:hypothetical protein